MDDSDDDTDRIEALERDIEELEAQLASNQKGAGLSIPQNELLTAHLLCENTQALVTAFRKDDEELDAEFGEPEHCKQQISALAALSGITFSNIRSGPVTLQDGLSRQMTLEASTAGLSFELALVVQEGKGKGGSEGCVEGKIRSAQLTVPSEFRAELSSLIDSAKSSCAVTPILRGLARYSQAAAERRRLFGQLRERFPQWISLPHGTTAAQLLSVRPPPGSAAPFVFDFVWRLQLSATGQLLHVTELIPNASAQFVECDDQHNVLEQMPTQFKHLAQAKGLQGALEIMLTLVSSADNVEV